MKLTFVHASAAVFAASVFAVSAGDVTGKVVLKGTPPPEKEIAPLAADPMCGKAFAAANNGATPKTRFFRLGAGGELADAFVYITKGLEGKTFDAPAAPVTLDQKGCEYVPYIVGAQAGQEIKVTNSDPFLHNVHPTPKVTGNPEANKAMMNDKFPPLSFKFSKPEVFLTFKCDVHPWMFSYVGVVEHPFFAVTGADGKFTLKNVPAGKYTIEVIHRKGGKTSAEVEVTGSGAKQDFTIELK